MQQDNENGEKLQQLKQRIDAAKGFAQEEPKPSLNNNNISAPKVLTELVAGVLVGAGLGYYVDRWLGTKPLFFIVLLFFGIAASIVNIYKLSAGSPGGEEKPPEEKQ